MKFEKIIAAAAVSWDFDNPTATEAMFSSYGKKEMSIVELVGEANFNFGEACQPPTTKKKVDEFFTTLLPQVTALAQLDFANASEDLVSRAAKYIDAVSTLYLQYLSAKSALPTLNSMVPVLEQVRDTIFSFDQPANKYARNNACKAMELYIVQERHQFDEFVPVALTGVLITLSDDLVASLTLRKANIKRMYALRRFMSKLDWSDETSTWMRQECGRVGLHSSMLKSPEGRKILMQLLSLDAAFTASLHTAAKPIIAAGKSGPIELLATVYYGAWRGLHSEQATTLTSAAVLQSLERCIQEIMDMSINAANTTVAKACLSFLQLGFFDQKLEDKLVDEALTRLFAPLLWRALDAANPAVRINALSVLSAAFPLQYAAEGDLASLEEQMQRQVTAFETALADEDVNVRAHAVRCVCGVLARWWEVFVEHATKRLASHVLLKCAVDAASVSVRVAAVEGVVTMLGNPLAHTLLKVLLPRLGTLIHDSSDQVQLAICELLLAVRRLRTVKFYEVTPLDDLLLRLTVTPNVEIRNKITELLAATYFPLELGNNELVKRALLLVRESPAAARAFYRSAHAHRPDAQLLKLACMLFKTVLLNAKHHRYLQLVAESEGAVQVQPVEAPPADSQLTPEQCRHTLLVVCDLWLTTLSYDSDPALRDVAVRFFEGHALDFLLLTYRDDPAVTSSILTIASCLPATVAPGLVASVLALPHAQTVVGALVRVMNKWGLMEDALAAAAVAIGKVLVAAAPVAADEVMQVLRAGGVEAEVVEESDAVEEAVAIEETKKLRAKAKAKAKPVTKTLTLRLSRTSPLEDLSPETAMLLLTRLYAQATATVGSAAGHGAMVLRLGELALGIIEGCIGNQEIPETVMDVFVSIGKVVVHVLSHSVEVLRDQDAVVKKYPKKEEVVAQNSSNGQKNKKNDRITEMYAERVLDTARVSAGSAMHWIATMLSVGTNVVQNIITFDDVNADDAADASATTFGLPPSVLRRKRTQCLFLTHATSLAVDALALGLAAPEAPLPALAAWFSALSNTLQHLRAAAVASSMSSVSISAAIAPSPVEARARLRWLSQLTLEWSDGLYRAMYWAVALAAAPRAHALTLCRAVAVELDAVYVGGEGRLVLVGDVADQGCDDQFGVGPSLALSMLLSGCSLPHALAGVSTPPPRAAEAVTEACKLLRLRGHANALVAAILSLLSQFAVDGAQSAAHDWTAILSNTEGSGARGKKKQRRGAHDDNSDKDDDENDNGDHGEDAAAGSWQRVIAVPATVLAASSSDAVALPSLATRLRMPTPLPCAGSHTEGAALAATAECEDDKPPTVSGNPIFSEWETNLFRAIFRSATLTTVLPDVVVALLDGTIDKLLHVPTSDDNVSPYSLSLAQTQTLCGADGHWTQCLPLSPPQSSSSSSSSLSSARRVDAAVLHSVLALGRSVLAGMTNGKAKTALQAMFADMEARVARAPNAPTAAAVKDEDQT